jgi:hypothetical protein
MFKEVFAAKDLSDALYQLAVVLLIIIISAFILRFLWNKVLVPHISVLKPVESLFDAFLLAIAISVIRG